MTPLLEVDDVWASRGDRVVLRGVTISLAEGEIVTVVGPSGSGKTTLLRVLLGFLVPDRGVVRLRGQVASAAGKIVQAPEERNLGVVFQDLALWPHLTVAQNLSFGLDARRVARAERDHRVAAMLEKVGLSGLEHRSAAGLSGGERQRVAVARALVLEPDAILLDEPLTHLDVGLRRELIALFRALFEERRVTAFYVTHDPREAVAFADKLVVLDAGRVVQNGPLEELRARPANRFVMDLLEELDWHGPR